MQKFRSFQTKELISIFDCYISVRLLINNFPNWFCCCSCSFVQLFLYNSSYFSVSPCLNVSLFCFVWNWLGDCAEYVDQCLVA